MQPARIQQVLTYVHASLDIRVMEHIVKTKMNVQQVDIIVILMQFAPTALHHIRANAKMGLVEMELSARI